MKKSKVELYIKIFNLKQKPIRLGKEQFLKACLGLCEKSGMSSDDASDFISKVFTTYNEYLFVNDDLKDEISKTILKWATTNFSKDYIWALSHLEYYPESQQWNVLNKQLSEEQKKEIGTEIINIVLELEKKDKEEDSLIVNTKSLTRMNGAYIPKSTWDYEFPISFCYEHTHRDETTLYRGLTGSVAQILSLLPLLNEQLTLSLLKKTSHPLIALYLSNKLVDFRRRQDLDIIDFIAEDSHTLLSSIAILKTFEEVQKVKNEIEARINNTPYRKNKNYEKLLDKELERNVLTMKSELINAIEKLNPEKSIMLASEIIANCEFIFHSRQNIRDEESIEIENQYPKLIAKQLQQSDNLDVEEIKKHLLCGTRDSKIRFLWHIGSHINKENPRRHELLNLLVKIYSGNILNLTSHKFHSQFYDRDFVEHINDLSRAITELNNDKGLNALEYYNSLFEELPVSIWDYEEDYTLFLEGIRHFYHIAIVLSIVSEETKNGKELIEKIRDDLLAIWEFYGDSSFIDETYPDLLIKNIYVLTHRFSEQDAEQFLKSIINFDYVPKLALKTIIENEIVHGPLLAEVLAILNKRFQLDLSKPNNNLHIWWRDTWNELEQIENELASAKTIYESSNSHRYEDSLAYLDAYTRYLESNPNEVEFTRSELQSIFSKTFPLYLQDDEIKETKHKITNKLQALGIHVRS